VKDWSNAVLLHPADKSQYPCPLIASTSVLGLIFFSLVQCIALCSHLPEPIWPDNSIMTQRTPNSQFLHTKYTILMLVRLSLSRKAHILFVHVTTKVEICLVTGRMKSKKSRCLKRRLVVQNLKMA